MRNKKSFKMSFPHVRFECIYCSKCCREDKGDERHIVLTGNDAKEISIITGMSIEEFAESNESERYPYVMKLTNGKCPFLGEDLRCRIYTYRPIICRFYPFVMQKIKKKYVFHVDSSCPGIGRGSYLDEEFFRNLIREAEMRLKLKQYGYHRS
ncbi:MAG: YkgJ family cysteine cluster protein [Thermoproteota archaeon]